MKINQNAGTFIEVKDGADFVILLGAPTDWAKARGATHSLISDRGGHRGAILMSSRIKVMTDEGPNGEVIWQTWDLKSSREMSSDWISNALYYIKKAWKDSGFRHLEGLQNWAPVQ